jgi:hypothetical protein
VRKQVFLPMRPLRASRQLFNPAVSKQLRRLNNNHPPAARILFHLASAQQMMLDRPSALARIDHRLFCRSTVGSFVDQPSALSPVIESTIERTNTHIVGPAETQKPHRNTQFTRTSTRRKMNSVLDGDERRGAYAPISWLHFTGLVHIQRRSTGWFYSQGSAP